MTNTNKKDKETATVSSIKSSGLLYCALCGEEIGISLFGHNSRICSSCYQDEIREKFGYDGDLL